MATKTAPKTAPRSTRKATTKSPAKASGKASAPTTTRGPSKETAEFAAKVVRLRDRDGLPWKDVAAKLGVPYDHNGSSRLRRAYTLGEGRTVGVRANAPKKAATKAKAAPKGRAKKAAPRSGAQVRSDRAARRSGGRRKAANA